MVLTVIAFLIGPIALLGIPPKSASPEELLTHALYLADLYNWSEAAPEFEQAEKLFSAAGDKRNALYAHFGTIRGTIERYNLPLTSARLGADLQSNSILKSDKRLRLFCLVIKGDIDQEIDSRIGRRDWEQVRSLAQEIGDKRWQNRALAQIGISAFYDRDLETASRDVGIAVAVAKKTGDIAAEVRYTTALGIAYLQGQMYAEALPYFDQALEISKAIPDSGYQFLTNQSRLEALIGLKRYDAAESLADNLFDELKRKRRTGLRAQTLVLAAEISLARGDISKAIMQLEESIGICKKAGFQQLQAQPEQILAEIDQGKGDLRKAELFATQAASDSQASGDKWSIPERLKIVAELQVRQGKYIEADRTFDRAAAFVDTGLANASSVLEKNALIKPASELYAEHFSLVASKLHDSSKAYRIVEQVRGRVITDLLMAGSINSPAARNAESKISQLQLKLTAAGTTEEVRRLRDQIFSLNESRWITPDMNILKRRSPETVTLQLVQQHLDRFTAILEYVMGEQQSYCLAITRNSYRIVPLAPQAEIETGIAKYLIAVRSKLAAHAEGKRLFGLLLQPIREAQQKQKLVIVRDGQLHLIPFDALEDSAGQYVLESHNVGYAPSATSYYLMSRERYQPAPQAQTLLALGGVPYEEAKVKGVSLSADRTDAVPRNLQNSRNEVLAIARALHTDPSKPLLGANATESAFKHAALYPYRFIHLAVHGVTAPYDPDSSALLLAPDRGAGEDGRLQASEVVMLHLNTDVAVLSACDTAIGPIEGEEGIAALSEAFLLAGARSVVSTLWSIDDTASVFLMEQFYSRVAAHQSPAEALETAKRKMLQTFGKAAVPYYWAAYTFEGVPGR
ncbi:MAG TPA: CHAT domain-containing protein [Bryobacteraceae bacterium]|nr:CHAT domain-containing protein [Bryobacteraceae bacterium]